MFPADPNPTLAKTHLSFEEGILFVKFADHSVIEVDDVIYIYCYGLDCSGSKPFALLFDPSSEHELSEEAIVYFSEVILQRNIVAIAYLSGSLLSKIRLSLFLIFEKPPIRPKTFSNRPEAEAWLRQQLAETQNDPAG